jgi:ribonuclease T1
MARHPTSPPPRWLATVLFVAIALLWVWTRSDNPRPPARELSPDEVASDRSQPDTEGADVTSPEAANSERSADSGISDLVVPRVVIKDQSGRVVYRGEVDLAPTLERIARGEKHPHRNDGGTFRNLEGRLPKQPTGYYTEYVHPTPGVDGPGPQRLVLGREGEVYYTPDHYLSFQRMR